MSFGCQTSPGKILPTYKREQDITPVIKLTGDYKIVT